MFFELFVAAALLCLGLIFFGHFEEGTPRWRRVLKIAIYFGGTALLSATIGRGAALAWVAAGLVAGLSVHAWWTRKHGIDFWTAEPWDRYRELRGWTREAQGR